MLIEALEHLRKVGAEYRVSDRAPAPFDAVVELALDDITRRFAVEIKHRAPFPSELPRLLRREAAPAGLIPMLVTDHVTARVARDLTAQGWSWIDEGGSYDVRAKGLRLSRRTSRKPPSRTRLFRLPQGQGAGGIMRFLISHGDVPLGPGHLANVARVTQPRASQVLGSLRDLGLVERLKDGWLADRGALLDAFLAHYSAPPGSASHLYSLEPVSTAATEITRANTDGVYLSADVAADLIAPWRRPTHLVIYAKRPLTIPEGLAVPARSSGDANITIRVPEDHSVFCWIEHEAVSYGATLRLAEHTQIIRDLLDLGGEDREAAADRVKRWLLRDR